MSRPGDERRPYTYTARVPAREPPAPDTSLETLVSIKDTLLVLTSECDVTYRQDGRYCEKHGLPVAEGSSRCGYLASRLAASTEDQRARIQQYVNETLGVRDPKMVKRLTG